jgi:LAO/AO transport system kinase
MEIGDIFVINKADREGVERTKKEVEALLSIAPSVVGWKPPVLETIATQGKGISDVVGAIQQFSESVIETGLKDERDLRYQRMRLLEILRDRLFGDVMERLTDKELNDYVKRVAARALDPYSAVDEMVERLIL